MIHFINYIIESRMIFKARTLFLTLDLAHRVYPAFSKLYSEPELKDKLLTILFACLKISNDIIEVFDLTEKTIGNILDREDDDFVLELKELIYQILIITKGVVNFPTYWDYAKSAEDLYPLLIDTINCNYDPSRIRELRKGSTKLIDIKFIPNIEKISELDPKRLTKFMPPFKKISVIRPCHVDTSSDLGFIMGFYEAKLLDEEKWSTEGGYAGILLTLLLHNKNVLTDLDKNVALDIFNILIENSREKIVAFVLDKICVYNWRKDVARIIEKRVHPFR